MLIACWAAGVSLGQAWHGPRPVHAQSQRWQWAITGRRSAGSAECSKGFRASWSQAAQRIRTLGCYLVHTEPHSTTNYLGTYLSIEVPFLLWRQCQPIFQAARPAIQNQTVNKGTEGTLGAVASMDVLQERSSGRLDNMHRCWVWPKRRKDRREH